MARDIAAQKPPCWHKPVWQMIRTRNAPAREPWLEEATGSAVPELRTFAAGIRRDQAAVLTALTYEWSQGQVEGAPFRRV